jgi:hypothetical protein
MQIPAKRTEVDLSFLLVLLLGCLTANAEQTPFGERTSSDGAGGASSATQPTAPSPSASSGQGAPSSGTSAPAGGSSTASGLDYLYNHKAQDGSAAQQVSDANRQAQNKAVASDAVGKPNEDPELKERFDRYLGMREVATARIAEYQAGLQKVSDLLRSGKTLDAWKHLYEMGGYQDVDAGISRELANRIESVWSTGRTSTKIDQANDTLQKNIKQASWNADQMSDNIRQKDLDYNLKQNQRNQQGGNKQAPQPNGGVPQVPQGGDASGGITPPPDTSAVMGKLQLTQEYMETLESKAKIKLNEMKRLKVFDQAKKDFADYITTLFKSGRFTHVPLAADFYRKVFEEGEYPAAMAQQVNVALELNRDVSNGVDVFRYKIGRQELMGANQSLEDAFAKNSLNLGVLGLERSLKEQLASFRQDLDKLQNLIEARDFSGVDGLLERLKNSAKDYDAIKPRSIVNAVKLESQLRLGKAKLAAQQGDQKAAMEEFQAAAQTWPGNPDLQDKALSFFNTQDTKNQALADFDRLVKEQNYREIFDKQLGFAPAIHGDAKREEQLKDALTKIKNAEIAVEKANTLMMNGDGFGAWESIELASKDLPDDKKLNKMRADLSGRSAEFVSAISKARDAEGRNEDGYSLTWYVNAQRQYPASRIANEGIDRLSKKLLQGKTPIATASPGS